jgi:hypothetical protein
MATESAFAGVKKLTLYHQLDSGIEVAVLTWLGINKRPGQTRANRLYHV